MEELIDRENYFTPEKTKNTLNTLALVALLLFNVGDGFLKELFTHMHNNNPIDKTPWLGPLAWIVLSLVGALIADLSSFSKQSIVIGFSILIICSCIVMATDILDGAPLYILFYLSNGMVIFPLYKELVKGSDFLNTLQKTVIMATIGASAIQMIFSGALNASRGEDSDLIIHFYGIAFMLGGLIVTLLGEFHKSPKINISEWLNRNPHFLRNLLIFIGIAILVHGIIGLANRFNYRFYFWGGSYSLLYTAAAAFLFAGIGALLVFVIRFKQPVWYVVTPTILVCLLVIAYFVLNQKAFEQSFWILLPLSLALCYAINYMLQLWLFKYNEFPLFTCLLVLHFLTIELAHFIIGFIPETSYSFSSY